MSAVHRHPTSNFDHSKLFTNVAQAEAEGLEVFRVFVQVYMDAFPILSSRKNESSEAVYFSVGNWNQEELQRLDNYFCLGHFPKGVNRHECFRVWLSEFAVLQDGFRVTLSSGKTVFLCGGIGVGKYDMPEAQAQAGALQQGADYPDRHSYIHRDDLDNLDYDLNENRKNLQQLRSVRARQAADPRSNEILTELQQIGMNPTPSALEHPSLQFDVSQQIPPQTCHSELLGIAGKALALFLHELTPIGQGTLLDAMQNQILPPHWDMPASLRVAHTGNLQCGVEDIRRNMQLLPFAIYDLLSLPPKTSTLVSKLESRLKFTAEALEKYRARKHNKPRSQGTEDLFTAFVAMAWSLKHTQARCRRSGSPSADRASLGELASAVFAGRKAVHANWPGEFNIPNFVTGRHYASATELYGVPAALSLSAWRK